MKLSRRHLLGSLMALPFLPHSIGAVENAAKATGKGSNKMKLGSVTYNLAKDWDVPTLIKNFETARFQGVELRTTHAHGVEVSLSKVERAEVKRRFGDSQVELMGLGSAFDYHTPDQSKLRKDIEATKEYIVLAQDVGATGVKVRPNGLPKEVPVEKTLEQIGRALAELAKFGLITGSRFGWKCMAAGLRSFRTSSGSSTWPITKMPVCAGTQTRPI